MFPDPSITRIVHDTMIAAELVHRDPHRLIPEHDGPIRPRRRSGFRTFTARALIRLADRIAPAPLPEPEPSAA
jgi:hypothetical protein